MELSKEECQYIISAIDTHIRNNGLNMAKMGVIVAMKIQGGDKQAVDPNTPEVPSGNQED